MPLIDPIIYPESDGQPIADNSKQLRWIFVLAGNLLALFRDRNDVFVGANLLWYPEEGHPEVRTAPDVFVAFGRPKGDRGSYKQWEENDVPMTVVFEVLSPAHTATEMIQKHLFYDEHGVEEYYLYIPDSNSLYGDVRNVDGLAGRRKMNGFVSPRLGVRFDLSGPELVVYRPDNRRFLTFEDLDNEREQNLQRAEMAEQRIRDAEQRIQNAERAERLAELTRKVLRQEATAEERQELEQLLSLTRQ